jgi:hypothetical protein
MACEQKENTRTLRQIRANVGAATSGSVVHWSNTTSKNLLLGILRAVSTWEEVTSHRPKVASKNGRVPDKSKRVFGRSATEAEVRPLPKNRLEASSDNELPEMSRLPNDRPAWLVKKVPSPLKASSAI